MNRIPDPIELLMSSTEREMDKIDADGMYPCSYCGVKFLAEDMLTISPTGEGALICDPYCGREEEREP